MGEASNKVGVLSTAPAEQVCTFGTIVLALWRENAPAELARRIKASKRHASYLIEGKRKVNARCIKVVVDEMLRDQ